MPKPDHPEAEERQRATRALELRTSGMTYAAVAAELGYTDESGPRKAVDRLLSRIEHEGTAELRRLEGQRLDAMQRAVWPQACGGNIDSIKAALAIMARRAKLYGLDAPQRVQIGPEISETEFAERAAELVGILRPETLRDMFAEMPSGRAVVAARVQMAAAGGDSPPTPISAVPGPYSAEIAAAPVEDEGDDWSNIGEVPPPAISPDTFDLDGVPDSVLAAAAEADDDDAAALIIDSYRAGAR